MIQNYDCKNDIKKNCSNEIVQFMNFTRNGSSVCMILKFIERENQVDTCGCLEIELEES